MRHTVRLIPASAARAAYLPRGTKGDELRRASPHGQEECGEGMPRDQGWCGGYCHVATGSMERALPRGYGEYGEGIATWLRAVRGRGVRLSGITRGPRAVPVECAPPRVLIHPTALAH